MIGADTDILRTALSWQSQGRKVAIATVVQTWGSAPQSETMM